MATKKASKKKTSGKAKKGSGPSKSDFIREKLKAGMSAADIVEVAAEHKMQIAPSMVYKLKSRLASGGTKATKGKPGPKKKGGRGSASEWVRQQLAAGKSPADIWAEAQRIKMKFSRNLIYTVKSADGSAKDKPGPKRKDFKFQVFPGGGGGSESELKQAALAVGFPRALTVVTELAKKFASVQRQYQALLG